jgi:hypothetical protein
MEGFPEQCMNEWTLALPKNIDTSSLRRESKHLASLLTTNWQRERQAGCATVSFRLYYLYLILTYLIFSWCQLPSCDFPKHTTAFHYRYDMQIFCCFCKPTFSGATFEWDALYILLLLTKHHTNTHRRIKSLLYTQTASPVEANHWLHVTAAYPSEGLCFGYEAAREPKWSRSGGREEKSLPLPGTLVEYLLVHTVSWIYISWCHKWK